MILLNLALTALLISAASFFGYCLLGYPVWPMRLIPVEFRWWMFMWIAVYVMCMWWSDRQQEKFFERMFGHKMGEGD